MRRIRFALACLTILLSGCNEVLKETSSDKDQGMVSIGLTSETDNRVQTKASEEDIDSHLGEFTLEIFNSKGIRLYRNQFAAAAETAIPLN